MHIGAHTIMKTYQKTLVSILIGLIAFPTITLGGSFVVNLIQGKTPAEAVQILAEQMDVLIGRVEVVETEQETLKDSQAAQEETIRRLQEIVDQQKARIAKEETCRKRDKYQEAKDKIDYYLTNRLIREDFSIIDPLPNGSPNRLDRIKYEETKLDYQQWLMSEGQ